MYSEISVPSHENLTLTDNESINKMLLKGYESIDSARKIEESPGKAVRIKQLESKDQ